MLLRKKSRLAAYGAFFATSIIIFSFRARADDLSSGLFSTSEVYTRSSVDLANDIVSGAFDDESKKGTAKINADETERIEAGGGLIPGTGALNSDLESACGTRSQCLDKVVKQARELPPTVWPDSLK